MPNSAAVFELTYMLPNHALLVDVRLTGRQPGASTREERNNGPSAASLTSVTRLPHALAPVINAARRKRWDLRRQHVSSHAFFTEALLDVLCTQWLARAEARTWA